MKKIVLTGGGTAGHVIPNLALIDKLLDQGWEIYYIGSYNGIERSLVPDKIRYHAVRTGKLRRYFDLKNFIDPFNVLAGAIQSFFLLMKLKPSIVFAKGGFVSVPVIYAAWLLKIPSITHEGDMSLGLANKLCLPFVKKICTSFQETLKKLPEGKAVYTGLPIRQGVTGGNSEQGLRICGFSECHPVILVMGGSLGSVNVNRNIRGILPELLKEFQVVHICGKGNTDPAFEGIERYRQFEFLKEELPHVFKAADIVISRAGTNSVFELLTMKKPCLFIPLSTSASRGEQVLNAEFIERNGFGKMLTENNMDKDRLISLITCLYKEKEVYIENMKKYILPDGTDEILKLINQVSQK